MILEISLGGGFMEQGVTIKVVNSINNRKSTLYLPKGDNLLDALVRSRLTISNECGGMGTCGKCVVRVVEGAIDISSQDKKLLSETELMEGYRLACTSYPDKDCTVRLELRKHDEYKVVSETLSYNEDKESYMEEIFHSKTSFHDKNYALAIDLGTTTLAFALVSFSDRDAIDIYTTSNPQRIYGADLISRIKISNEGKLKELSNLIRDELRSGIFILLAKSDIDLACINQIIISGNTTMIHILMEYSCNNLGSYPFTAVNLGIINTFSDELLTIDDRIPIMIMPSISVFVGGDITAGLLACGFYKKEKPCLFIDLGTNGEIALGNKDGLLVTSTAAGPAFEGGSISCGVGSIPGAICNVSFKDKKLSYSTINDQPPVGLCGTGLIELVSGLLKKGIIDSTGLLGDTYFDNGYPIAGFKLKQEDIRELQLAKSAIRAGVDILLKNFSIPYEELDEVYIAGGFGYHLNIEKAIIIGLLPESLKNKVKAVGNTSLSGAIYSIRDTNAAAKLQHIISSAEEIHLSNEEDFNDLFINYLSF